MGNQAQLISSATSSTSTSRRSVFSARTQRGPATAPRTCTSASEKPAEKMNDGATSPSAETRNLKSRSA